MKHRTIILTSSIRVTVENEEDLATIQNNLENIVANAYGDGSNIVQGPNGATCGDITTDTEVCDDE